MQSNKLQFDIRSTYSRRKLIQGTAIAALSTSLKAQTQSGTESAAVSSSSGSYFAYVGTYTGAIGGGGNGEGIYLYQMNAANGRLSPIKVVSEVANGHK